VVAEIHFFIPVTYVQDQRQLISSLV